MKSIHRLLIVISVLLTVVIFTVLSNYETSNVEPSFTAKILTVKEFSQRKLPIENRRSFQSPSPSLPVDKTTKKWEQVQISASEWGERVGGVLNRIDTDDKIIALTFDACGGPFGSEYDQELIDFLRKEEIPATLFINARWIESNKQVFLKLAEDPLFSIQNHGTNHLPLSIHGQTAWGIQGTSSVEGVIEEVIGSQQLIYSLTGDEPMFFRSGTAYYDEVAVQIVNDLGLQVVNFDILGDAGATFSASQVESALLQSKEGSIPLLHMNQPSSGTAEGVMNALPELINRGYTFVHLNDKELIP